MDNKRFAITPKLLSELCGDKIEKIEGCEMFMNGFGDICLEIFYKEKNKEQDRPIIKYKHKQLDIIGEVNRKDNHLHYTIVSGEYGCQQSTPMILIENSNDWEKM